MEQLKKSGDVQIATLAGGCFWCLEAIFEQLRGVTKVESGYAGGSRPNPSYEQVSTGATGHAEVVQITYDSDIISFRDLLHIFFSAHDPTTLNRQGADAGPQYRSAIFFHDSDQEATTREVIAGLEREKVWDRPIVTELAPFASFYPAEEYHQHYFEKNPDQPYCRAVIEPKVAKIRSEYFRELKK